MYAGRLYMIEGPLSRWEVSNMITLAIDKANDRQDMRHKENSQKLDKLIWLIIITLLSALGSLTTNLLGHILK